MEIEYDKKIDTRYVRIMKGKISSTHKERDWLLFDCADNGDVLGVEILDASKHLVSISTVGNKLVGYSFVEPKVLKNGSENIELKIPKKDFNLAIA